MSPYSIFDIVNTVIVAGGEPEFIDFKNSFDLDVKQIESSIKKGDCCCILVTNYSVNSNIIQIKEMFKSEIIVQDCAIALASMVKSKSIGCLTDYAFLALMFLNLYQ